MARFEYTPIDLKGRSFRLLRLMKGESLPIRGELFDAFLYDTDQVIEYEALSYAWGLTDKPHDVEINGKSLAITANLFLALRHLRSTHTDRILWIDAICIDQNNHKEQGHQVKQMTNIYRNAGEVLIWLGRETRETNLLFDYMRGLELKTIQEVSRHWEASDPAWTTIWPSINVSSHVGVQYKKGLQTLLDRPWFGRVWIIQEVANARFARVMCGDKSVTARIFRITASKLGVEPESHCQAILDILPGPSRMKSWWNGSRNLRTLLLKFRGSEASDARDHIYALLGISIDEHGTYTIEPDYEKHPEEVVSDTVEFLLRNRDGNCCIPRGLGPRWTVQKFLQNVEVLEKAVLAWATENQHEAIVERLIAHKTDIDWVDESGRTPLLIAVEKQHEAMTKMLLTTAVVNRQDFKQRTPLTVAVSQGNEAIVSMLLRRGANPDLEDAAGQSPLSLAVVRGQATIFKLLVQRSDFDINWQKEDGQTLLILAVGEGQETVVELLIEGGADVNLANERGQTPLLLAVGNRQEKIVKLLLKNGAEINKAVGNGLKPLILAVNNKDLAMVRLLLAEHAFVNIKDTTSGYTPLLLAAENRDKAVLKLLLDTGKADVNSADHLKRTPLSFAVKSMDLEITRLLLETYKVDIKTKDHYGMTPVLILVQIGSAIIVKLLFDIGEINDTYGDGGGWKLLWEAAQIGHDAIFEALFRLIATEEQASEDTQADFRYKRLFRSIRAMSRSESGQPCLWNLEAPAWWAAKDGHHSMFQLLFDGDKFVFCVECMSAQWLQVWTAIDKCQEAVQLLLDPHKIDFDRIKLLTTDWGRVTMLWWAALNKQERILRWLLDLHKHDINWKNEKSRTALSIAAERGHVEIVGMLLATGRAEIDSKDTYCCTPLWRAAREGHEEVVKLLLSTGKVDINAKDRYDRRTPLGKAAQNGHAGVVKLLLDSGKADVHSKETELDLTPRDCAELRRSPEMRKMLDEYTRAKATKS